MRHMLYWMRQKCVGNTRNKLHDTPRVEQFVHPRAHDGRLFDGSATVGAPILFFQYWAFFLSAPNSTIFNDRLQVLATRVSAHLA